MNNYDLVLHSRHMSALLLLDYTLMDSSGASDVWLQMLALFSHKINKSTASIG